MDTSPKTVKPPESWVPDIERALLHRTHTAGAAANVLMGFLRLTHSVQFDNDCPMWVTDLVGKWRSKTPDVHQQAVGIAGALFKRFTFDTPKSGDMGAPEMVRVPIAELGRLIANAAACDPNWPESALSLRASLPAVTLDRIREIGERLTAYADGVTDNPTGSVSELDILRNRVNKCATSDEADKMALIRALQEIAQAVGLSPLYASPHQVVDAVRGMVKV